MNDERQKWRDQFQAHFGAEEYIRFSGAVVLWLAAGVAVSVAAQSGVVFVIFFLAFIIFSLISTSWKPAYRILRWILGNKDLPAGPLPRAAVKPGPHPWWSFLPGLWWWLMALILFFLVIRYFGR